MDETKQLQVQSQVQSDEDIGIDLYDLFYLFRQKLVGILIAFVIGGAAVGAFTFFFIAPKYQATAKMYITSTGEGKLVDFSELQIGNSLTDDYEELMLARPLLESVKEELQLTEYEVDDLAKMISVANPASTRILNITVTSTDPQEAMNIANKLVEKAVTWLPAIMKSNEPTVPEDAILPQKKSSPSYSMNTLIGALAFAAVYYGIAVLRYLHDDSIRTSDDLERYFGIAPLTSIPEEKDVHDHAEDEKRGKSHKKGKGEKAA